uniref:NADH dehydrogenase subunit 2 n=1 Tax=Polyascus gregaria TaxID=238043 RepID=H8ZWN6_9CRUS|nr:NADH dehydrogenase subunit 2 [Polyascus gregaria]
MLIFHLYYVFFIFFGTLLSIMSMNWFWSWFGMELCLFSFFPLMLSYTITYLNYIVDCKYFLIQSLGSIFLFLGLYMMKIDYFTYLFVVGFIMKLGLYPFLSYMFDLSLGLTWDIFWIFSSLIKFSSMYFFSMFMMNLMTIVFVVFFFTSIYSLLFMITTNILKIFIMGSSYIQIFYVYLIIVNLCDFVIYYFMYLYVSYMVVYMMFLGNFEYFSDLYMNNSFFSLYFVISMLSYMGFPFFFGFYMKLYILSSLCMYMYFFFFLIMILSFYSYIRLMCLIFLNLNVYVYKFFDLKLLVEFYLGFFSILMLLW